MRIVGVTGRAGSGKDTIADWFVCERGYTKVALADPMKEFCRTAFGWSHDQLWGPSARRSEPDPRWNGLTPRRALQQLGTEWGRAMHPDVWIRLCLDRSCTLNVPVVVADIRFQNEVDMIQQAGGVVVAVTRPRVGQDSHSSEAGVNRVDFGFVNDGTLKQLYEKLAAVFPVSILDSAVPSV